MEWEWTLYRIDGDGCWDEGSAVVLRMETPHRFLGGVQTSAKSQTSDDAYARVDLDCRLLREGEHRIKTSPWVWTWKFPARPPGRL